MATKAMCWGMLPGRGVVIACTSLVSCLLMATLVHGTPQPRTGYACEGSTLTITCTEGYISIIQATWGRRQLKICNTGANTEQWSRQCFSTRAPSIVSNICDGESSCEILADITELDDPCHQTSKYLEVEYSCIPGPPSITYGSRGPTTTTTTTSTTTTTTPPTTTTPTTTTIKRVNEITAPRSRPSSSTTTPTTTTPTPTTTTSTTTASPTPPPVLMCVGVETRNITWPNTPAGITSRVDCPNNPQAKAVWQCGRAPVGWVGAPNLAACVSQKTIQLREKLQAQKQRPSMVAMEMVEASQTATYGGDVVELTSMMTELVDQVETEVLTLPDQDKRTATQEVSQAVVASGSSLLAEDHQEMWHDLPQAEQAQAATKLITAVEKSAYQRADTVQTPLLQPIINIEVNIMVQVNVISATGEVNAVTFPDKSSFKNNKWTKSSDCIHIPGNSIKQLALDRNSDLAKLVFVTYKNLEEMLRPQQDREAVEEAEEDTNSIGDINPKFRDPSREEPRTVPPRRDDRDRENKTRIVNTNIISASVNGHQNRTIPVPEPIFYTLEHKTSSNIYNPTCSFWEYSERTMTGEWSNFGCEVVETNVTHTVCKCNHLTNFAILMDVTGTKVAPHHLRSLEVITYIGCAISILCLFLAWLTFQFCKNLQCDRNTIHKNLVFCLFFAEIVFLAGITQFEKPVLCSVVAGLLHYLFLAAFAWMCLEGVQLYMMLIEVFEAERSRLRYYYIAAYGIPAVIVAISAAVYHQGYGTDWHCWLTTERGFIWAFVGPVIGVISVNVVMLSIAIYVMCRHAAIASSLKMKEKSRLDNIRSWLKGAAVLVVLLGLTWSFGLLYVSEESVFCAYLFTILNSLQGLFIFLFHCVMNEKVQKEYKRCARRMRWLPACIRVNYGGAKPYTSTSPHSTSSGSNKMSKPLSIQYLQRLLSGRRRKRSSTTTLQRSSTPSTKWNYQNMQLRYSSGEDQAPPGQAPPPPPLHSMTGSMTEDPDGYLEPLSIRINDSCTDPGGCNGDVSMIDGSVVDSNYLSEYCKEGGLSANPPINVEKYKIKKRHRQPKGLHQLSVDDPRLSESEYSDAELFNMTDNERQPDQGEQKPLVPKTELEMNMMNSLPDHQLKDDYDDDTIKKKRLSSSSGSSGDIDDDDDDDDDDDSITKDSPSLNDLNRSGSDASRNSIYLSTPNIKFKSATGGRQEEEVNNELNSKDSACKRSLPNLNDIPEQVALDKVKKAISTSDDGLITLSHGKPVEKRFSRDTEEAMAAHRYRLTSSDC